MGVKIDTDMVMGKVLSVDELFEMGYEALYIGTGAGLPNFMICRARAWWAYTPPTNS